MAASRTKPITKTINLALQGGGSHGAFTWGVLDQLLEDGRLRFEAISATSAGSLNAVVLAEGMRLAGVAGARAALERLWRSVSELGGWSLPGLEYGLVHAWAAALTQLLSPYQLNPLGFNPLRELLQAQVDFEALRRASPVRLFVSATNVETGKIKVFSAQELSLDAVLASACLPNLFPAQEIGGQYYWDGGFMGNPAIFPLIYEARCADVLIVHVNPIVRRGLPRSAAEIADRVNEISFNSTLMREMRAIAFVTSLIDRGKLSPQEARRIHIHSIRSDELMAQQGASSKFDVRWRYLCGLRDAGREQARAWLATHLQAVGRRSSVDIRAEFL
ncbi:MAG: patatin-like phospholipase family protein [Burkholderiales bacterium]|nr:MAG: patatin-like phospholipase family protein [Burkholderiales bacterium]